jgi:hypothetical protein
VLHLVLPAELADEQLRVGDELDLADAQRAGAGQAEDGRLVLGDVVGLAPEELLAQLDDLAGLGVDDRRAGA